MGQIPPQGVSVNLVRLRDIWSDFVERIEDYHLE